ncbi:Nn.00g015600.m01.CDS01 [Neocucurbitaria sp. VM-36]
MSNDPERLQSLCDEMRSRITPAPRYTNMTAFRNDIIRQLDTLANLRPPRRYIWPQINSVRPSKVKQTLAYRLTCQLYNSRDGNVHLTCLPTARTASNATTATAIPSVEVTGGVSGAAVGASAGAAAVNEPASLPANSPAVGSIAPASHQKEAATKENTTAEYGDDNSDDNNDEKDDEYGSPLRATDLGDIGVVIHNDTESRRKGKQKAILRASSGLAEEAVDTLTGHDNDDDDGNDGYGSPISATDLEDIGDTDYDDAESGRQGKRKALSQAGPSMPTKRAVRVSTSIVSSNSRSSALPTLPVVPLQTDPSTAKPISSSTLQERLAILPVALPFVYTDGFVRIQVCGLVFKACMSQHTITVEGLVKFLVGSQHSARGYHRKKKRRDVGVSITVLPTTQTPNTDELTSTKGSLFNPRHQNPANERRLTYSHCRTLRPPPRISPRCYAHV